MAPLLKLGAFYEFADRLLEVTGLLTLFEEMVYRCFFTVLTRERRHYAIAENLGKGKSSKRRCATTPEL